MNFTADKLKQARDAGYSDDEIWGFVAEQDDRFTQAKDAGYSLEEVSGFFSEQPEAEPAPLEPQAPVGTSFMEEIGQIPEALKQAVGQPLEAMGETAEVLGAPEMGATLRGAIEEPEGYIPAAQRFMQPQEGEFQIGGFAPQFLPRAIVEQAGQIGGAILTRAVGGAVGGIAGATLGPKGAVAGAVAGQFLGPALFEMSQIVGPVARERAANQGREEPTTDDLAWAWSTAGASGALNAIGAKYLPNGDKLVGGLAKRIAASVAGEGTTEGLQSTVQQVGQSFLTEQGLQLKPKESFGEAIMGGGAGGVTTLAAAPFSKASAAAETKVAAEQAAPVAPETAQAVSEQANQVIAEAQAEETAETPEQRVARLQEEATAAAGIELEEEGVGVEPTVPVTPPVAPTPEGAVAPVEPVVEPVVAEPQPVAEVAVEPIPEVIATPEGERARAFYHSGPRPLTVDTASFDKGAMGFHMGARTQAEWVAKDKRKAEISSFYVRDASADQELETESIERDMSWEQADALLVELVSEGILDKQEAIDLANNWGDMSADHKQALSNDLQKVKFGDEYVGMDGDVGEFMLQSSTYKNADKLGQIRQLLVDKGIGAIEYVNEVEGVGGNPQAVAIFDKRMLAEAPAAPAVTPPAEVAPTPEAVAPTPETPNLEPLRRVARAEQTEEDVSGLVGQGLVELYNGQPVITQAGLEALPEAERPRLTPEARKIQIDTGSNEVVAEAIAKNLRIGVDQVGTGVRMPAGWILVEDIYVPPKPIERIVPSDVETLAEVDEDSDVFSEVIRRKDEAKEAVVQKPEGSAFANQEEFRAAFDLRGEGHGRFATRLDLMVADGVITNEGKDLIMAVIFGNNTNDEFLKNMEMGSMRPRVSRAYGRGGVSRQTVESVKGMAIGYKPSLRMLQNSRKELNIDERTAQTLSTFWHEFGHAGYYSLLDKAQKDKIASIYRKTTKAQREKFFASGVAAARQEDVTARYYAKSETEWFAQSFAEYVLTKKSDQKTLVPIFNDILNKVKNIFGKLFSRKEGTPQLEDIFEYIIQGKDYGSTKIWWNGMQMSLSPAIYGVRGAQPVDPSFSRKLVERERQNRARARTAPEAAEIREEPEITGEVPPTAADIIPETVPTFSEGSPEASTLSTMAASMAKVDAVSEAKPNPENKPTYKINEIASVWMDQGGDARQLQDMVVEYTNLTPANAKKVANAIAKQYDIQQSIKTAFLETPAGVSVEALPEGVTLPKEVDPDRPRPVMARLFDVFMGVRVPPVKITVNEKTALKQQIRLKAAANRAAKQEQQRTADEVVEVIKAMELRGPVRPKQAQALAKRAAKAIWTSEKSMESFVEYAAKVVENANYDADLREAKAAQKRAKELSKQKKVAMSPQRLILQQIGNVAANKLDDPRMFAEMINYYLRGFKDVRSPDYVVVPDEEITGYISKLETESVKDQAEVERETNERLARKYDLDPNTIPELMSLINIIEEIEGRENREALESILTDKAIETQDGLRGYDTTALTNTQKNLVESMLNVDLKSINTQERQMFIRIANNMIYNNQTNGAEYFVATAKGQQNARKAAQDSKMIQRNKAWIPLIPSFGSLKLQETLRNFSLELQSLADTFRNVFGKDFMAKAYEMMGMLDLNEGFTKANNTIDEIQDLMAEFHQGNEKTYGDAARNQDGILSEGVAGFLIQEFPFKDEATSIQQRRNLINEYIANARESRQKDRVAMADRVEAILNKVDGASVQEILNNMKREYRPNYDSLMWYKDVLFPKYKDFLKQFDENFNDQANNYDSPNYLPIAFTSAGPALALGPEDVSIANSISLQPKQSVYTIKRQDYTKLPKDKDGNPKEIEFNLRRTAFNSLSDQINKAYTNPAWQQIFAFMKTPESVEFFGDKANRDFFVDRLNRLRASRARRGSVSGGALEKALDSFSIISRKLGTGIALGGVFQWIKQPPDQLLTALGSGGRADLLAKNIAPSTQKAARELLNQFSIGRRGDSSAGYKYINQMEGHQSRMERYFSESKWEQAKEQGGKIADVWMVALKKSDFISASAAWMTYYEGELNKNDIKIDDWAKEAELVKTDPVRRQAAAYAEQMTDIYQGSSDPTSMATFAQSGKTGWENFTKALLVPFNSFAIQQRMRLYSDARDALNGTSGGKGGLAGTIGGLILFHTTKRFVLPVISGGTAAILYGMLGVDMEEPDEEKQKEMADRNWRQFLADITGNLLVGGTPQLVENRTIEAFNYASYMVGLQLESETVMDENGEIMSFDKYSKERSPFYRYKSYDNAMSLGMFDIGFDQAKETALQTKMLMDRDEMEMYTPEEQRLLYFSALSEWLYLMRLNDTDFARIVKKARRDMIKAAEEREKELARIRAGR
jgi:hypothetical protein